MEIVVGQRDLDKYAGQAPSYEYFEASLIGLRKVMARRMSPFLSGPEKVVWSTTADWRSTLLLRKKLQPPFIRLAVRSIALDPTRINLRAASRSGIFSRYIDAATGVGGVPSEDTVSMLREIKGFPITVNCAGYWVGRDVAESMKAGIWLMMLSQATGGLSFVIDDSQVSPYEVQVRTDNPEWTVPGEEQGIDLETEGSEELGVFSFNLVMNTLFNLSKYTPNVRQIQTTVTVTGEEQPMTGHTPPTSDQRKGQVED